MVNKDQKANLAKFFYDTAKLTFGAAVLTAGFKGQVVAACVGMVVTVINVMFALNIEKDV